MDAAANKRGRGKGTRSTGRTVAAAVAVGGGAAASSGTNSTVVLPPSVVTLERRSTLPMPSISGSSSSSSTVLGVAANNATATSSTTAAASAPSIQRKLLRLAGKRHTGKGVSLGATTSKLACSSRTHLVRKALPVSGAVVGSVADRLHHRHGGVVPPIISTATANRNSANEVKLGKHHHPLPNQQNGYGTAAGSSYAPIVPYGPSGLLDGADTHQAAVAAVAAGTRMVATSVSPLSPQTLSPSTGSSSPSISPGVSLAASPLASCTGRQNAPAGGGARTANSTRGATASSVPFRMAPGTDGSFSVAGVPPALISSRDGKIQLQIVTQPEQQHRARYQTEGSRGAVKDRSGNGFPVVRLVGYNKPAALLVYIGSDVGRPTPHIFYQACKVSGKNSTPCVERILEGTKYIEVQLKPENNMTVTCDCVGILKERNVDVEYRFPDQTASRTKKKSTRCRMVFRTTITGEDGATETLQVSSHQIICTQPPGVPEILKKSLISCPVEGGLELFIIGKNFLKDTRVVFHRPKAVPAHSAFTRTAAAGAAWEHAVAPDKEHLNQVHLICKVPPYERQDITEPVTIKLYILSSGKKSETHDFIYTPKGEHTALSAATTVATIPGRRNRLGTAVGQQQQQQQQQPSPQHQQQQPPPTSHNYFSELAGLGNNGAGLQNGGNVTAVPNVDGAALANAINAIAATAAGMGELPGPNGAAGGRFVCNGNRTEAAVSPFDEPTNVHTSRPMFLRTSTPLEIEAKGMMPPPINVLPTGSIIPPQCHPGVLSLPSPNQPIQPAVDVFKPELVEPECSRGHMADEESLDQFAVKASLARFGASVDNSLDGILFAPVPAEPSILYRRRSVRQPSMEMEDSCSNMSLLANDSRMMDLPSAGGAAAAAGGGGGGGGSSGGGSLSIGSHFDTVMNIAALTSFCGSLPLAGRGVVGNGVPTEVPVPVVQPVSAVPAVGVARPLEVVVEPAIPMDSIGLHPSQESLAEESRALASELTAMTETELMNYICPSAFDAV
uniref:Nuclear factor of activated T-cells 5 n=1 Tax=Anopheles merus TaxID=30066 RepID=A0A182UN35_ANOME